MNQTADNASAPSTETLDRFYDALARKDLEAARACCSPGALFWHNFDALAQDLDAAAQGWAGMFAAFDEHRVADVRRQPIPGGVVQRHLFLLRAPKGDIQAKPCCIFVALDNGLISRLDEYIDLSGSLTVNSNDSAPAVTPGLAPDGAFLQGPANG